MKPNNEKILKFIKINTIEKVNKKTTLFINVSKLVKTAENCTQ